MRIQFETNKDDEEKIYVVREDETRIEMKEYLENHVEESLHELIRRHVFIATRNYNNRVQAFLSKILMDKSNPMCVKYWTTKVEFQGRGAGHNHGTIWVDMQKMEFTYVDKNGKWGNLLNQIHMSKNKAEIIKSLGYLLDKYHKKKEIFEDKTKIDPIIQNIY